MATAVNLEAVTAIVDELNTHGMKLSLADAQGNAYTASFEVVVTDELGETHALELSTTRDYGGNFTGTCGTCFDVDYEDDRYVSTGDFSGPSLEDLIASFDDHVVY